MKTSTDVTNIFPAIVKMQSELKDIGKDSNGYGYKYTSFESLTRYLRPLLTKHNLGFIQTSTSEDGKIGVTTRLIHTTGEWIEDTLTLPLVSLAKMNDYQVAGSAITYFKRYGLSAIVGIASDEDIDATGEQETTQKELTKDQLIHIRKLLKDSQTEAEKFLAFFKVDSLNKLPYDKAVNALEAKIKKAS